MQHPGAELVISSASSIGYTLDMMARGTAAPTETHICGGVGAKSGAPTALARRQRDAVRL